MKKNKPTSSYKLGKSYENPYLGNKVTEVLNNDDKRLGYIWTHSDGRVVVSPNLGFYVWFGPKGEPWTQESAANWLVLSSKKAIM